MRTLDLLVSPDRHRGFPPPLRSAPAERKRFRGQARARSGREPSGLQRQVLVVAFAARIIDILPRDSLATLRKRGASMGLPVPGEWSRLCGPRRGWRILDAARGLLRLPHDVVLALSARYDRQDRRPPRAAADRVRSSRRRRVARHPAALRGLSRSFSVVAQRGSGTVRRIARLYWPAAMHDDRKPGAGHMHARLAWHLASHGSTLGEKAHCTECQRRLAAQANPDGQCLLEGACPRSAAHAD